MAEGATVTIATGYLGESSLYKGKGAGELTGSIDTLGTDATLNLYGIRWENTKGVDFISLWNGNIGTVNILGDTITRPTMPTKAQTGDILIADNINIGKNSVVHAYAQAMGKMTISDNAKVGTLVSGNISDPTNSSNKALALGSILAVKELDINLNSDGAVIVRQLKCGSLGGDNFKGTIKLADKSDTLLVTYIFQLPEAGEDGEASDAMLTISKGTLYSMTKAAPRKNNGAGNLTVSGDAVATIAASEASTFGTLNVETSDTVFVNGGATITELNITEADAGTTALMLNGASNTIKGGAMTPNNLAAFAVGYASDKVTGLDGTTGKKAPKYTGKEDKETADSIVNTQEIALPVTFSNLTTAAQNYYFFKKSTQKVITVTFMIPADTVTAKDANGKTKFTTWKEYGKKQVLALSAKVECPVDSFNLDGQHLVTVDGSNAWVQWYTDSACTNKVKTDAADADISIKTNTDTLTFGSKTLQDTVLYAKLAVVDSVVAWYMSMDPALKGKLVNSRDKSTGAATAMTGGSLNFAESYDEDKKTYSYKSDGLAYYDTKRKFSELTAKVTSPAIQKGTFAIALKDTADIKNISSLAADDSITFPQTLVKDTTWNLVLADSVVFFEDNSLKNPIKKTIVLFGDTLASSLIPEAPTKEGYVFDGWYYVLQNGNTPITSFDVNSATAVDDHICGKTKKAPNTITTTIYVAPKWVIGVYAVVGEDTIPVAKLATKDFAATKATETSAQVDLYNTESMPIGTTDAPAAGTSGVVLASEGIVNLYYLPLDEEAVNVANFTDAKYTGERLNAAINWYTDAAMTQAITSWPYSVKEGKTETVFIYGYKPVEIMQVFDYGYKKDTLIDTLASGTKYSEAFILDSLKIAEYLWNEKVVDVIGWTNNAGDTIASDYKWTKNDTLYPICDTVVVLNFYSNDYVNTLYQIIVHYGDTLETKILSDQVKTVGDTTLTFQGWYVPCDDEYKFIDDNEVQYSWDEKIVKSKDNMMSWDSIVIPVYNLYANPVKAADKAFGNNGIINIYGYWPGDTTGGDPTGINEVNGASENAKTSNGHRYNLAGQEVDDNYSGVVILNGVKRVNK